MDRQLNIATGNSRTQKTWKNKTVTWAVLADRLKTTVRTPETMAEYRAMSRDRQSGVKDVGGFVGGLLKNGSRKDVVSRSILCLDADYAAPDLFDDFELLIGCAAVVYSTHTHTPKKPRLRVVVPLSRDVTPEEYPAIGRRIAETLGIDQFDDSTYEPQRVMFWPSTPQDGEYYYRRSDGDFLDPDEILGTYEDWRDVSTWPISSRIADVVVKRAEKAEDPVAKRGPVGTFCRAYSIQAAIEAYVPDYVPCDIPGRYTYAKGSTAAGVVVYDDKFVYSHHATDPASGMLCNAWDLVRIHRFGELDADAAEGTRSSSLPSYKAMAQLALEDPLYRQQVIEDRTGEAMADFEAPVEGVEPAEPQDKNWTRKIKVTEKGAIAMCIENVVIILNHDPKLRGCLAQNDLDHNIVAVHDLPWRKVQGVSQWIDADDSALRYYLEKKYGLSGKDKIFDAVNVVAQHNHFHPIRDYLDSCSWDGVPRVDTLLIDYLGAEDTPYTRAVTRKTLAAAVARVYRPGCKFDYMLTIRGTQGIGKTALVTKLGGDWYSDSFSTLQGKDAYEQVLGVWLVEVGELAGLRKAEVETIKLFISKQVDRFRPAYGRRLQEFPRQCVFIGTTNETQFLRDSTGNRRFWVVDTPDTAQKNLWDELTPEMIKNIWGEAKEIFRAGEALYLSRELEEEARMIQESFEEENPRAGVIQEYLERKLPEKWETMDIYTRRQWLDSGAEGTVQRQVVCTMEIWAEALGGSPDRIDRYAAKEIRDILARLPEWRPMGRGTRLVIRPYGQQYYYIRRPV